MTCEEKVRLLADAISVLIKQVDSAKWPAPYNLALIDALGGARAALAAVQYEEV